MTYDSFWEAYQAKNPTSPYTPAGQTWTPQNLQGLGNAYSALNPTWTPPAAQNAALPHPIQPVTYDPMGDVGYAATASQNIKTVGHAQDYHDYQQGSGEQNYGYDAQGNLITSGSNYNPYSQAAVLQRNYDNTKRGTTNNYASQGQLYAGSYKNANDTNAYNYNTADDRLKRNANDYYHANDYSLTQTKDNADAILAQLLGPTFQNFLAGQKG